jgi:iron complex outermembrane receptor protein
MKKALMLIITTSLFGAEMDKVTIEEDINSLLVKDVSQNEIKSADVADALYKNVPSVNIIRRSAIANDILLRGQKRDDINIIIDGTKVCGACVNRMDPPTSHILSNNVKLIKVSEGPFDVENFGTLSGVVDITTKKPTSKDIHGEIGINGGSFDYQKWYATISGGGDKFKMLLSASTEKGGQYEDGDGEDFYDQIQNNIDRGVAPAMVQYQDRYKDMDAFIKSTLMGKIFIDITDNQELKLSYTANRSDDVLYPSSKMDAVYDDSDIYNFEYLISNLSSYSKLLSLQIYRSQVDHPMSTVYRKSTATMEKTHYLTTEMTGIKLKNSYDSLWAKLTIGLDYSLRNWDGKFTSNGKPLMMQNGKPAPKSLNDVDTKNRAIFIKADQDMDNINIKYGVRYDYTDITTASLKEPDNDYGSLSANIFATIKADDSLTYFAGVGNSYRVPDARELYLFMMGNHFGTPNLDQSQNIEVDLGVEKIFDNFSIKAKSFYSYIKDYIAFNASNKKLKQDGTMGAFHSFENVDATIYGVELSGMAMISDTLSLDYGVAYKRGKKKDPLTNQHSTNLPNMRPLKANISANFEPTSDTSVKVEFIGASRWSDIDSENGEQELGGYGIVNLKVDRKLAKRFTLTLGVDNLLDKTYAITNTYRDLTLLTTNTKVDNVMLLNEPGRYLYANLKWEF